MQDWASKTIEGHARENGRADALTRRIIDAAMYVLYDDILDIGCGTGAALRDISDRWSPCEASARRLIGIDLPRTIRHARDASKGYDITFVEGTVEALPFPDQSIHTAFAINSCHHWQDRATAFKEIARVLMPQGCFVVAGERRGQDVMPEGQEFAKEMARVGIPVHHSMDLEPGGFFTYGRKAN